jgi:pimeloyl-ACP methyl ester carboxylesterase
VLHDWISFAAVLLASGILAAATMIMLLARTLLRPTRMTDGKATWVLQRLSPGDLKLNFEELKFQVRDEQTGKPLAIAAWWIPARSGYTSAGGGGGGAGAGTTRTILLIHGYADAKVGAIAWAPTLHALGWNILAIDLRAHGESGGTLSTAGYWERHDVTQVINQFRAMRSRETQVFAIFGISLGAAVAVATAAMRDDIDAVILESPFADYRPAVAAHGKMRGLPGGWMRDTAIRLAELLSGADFRAVRPRDLIPKLTCPVMIVHAGQDPFIPPEDAAALAESLKSRGNARDVLWSVPGAGHVLGLVAVGPDEYRARVARFLDTICATGPTTTTSPIGIEAAPTPAAVPAPATPAAPQC